MGSRAKKQAHGPADDRPERALDQIAAASRRAGFGWAIDEDTGRLLRVLSAAKAGGRFLELGTGTGSSAAWIAHGMDQASTLTSVEWDRRLLSVARRVLGSDARIQFVHRDAAKFLRSSRGQSFDLVFADTHHGKFAGLASALDLVAPGGLYVVDNLVSRQEDPSPEHRARVRRFRTRMRGDARFHSVELGFSTGLLLAARR